MRPPERVRVAGRVSALALVVVTVLGVAAMPAVGPRGRAAAAGTASGLSFAAVDSAMRARLRGQHGGAVLIVHDRTTVHWRTFQGLRGTTRLPVASAGKWLTTATLMTLVDQGRVGLDDPVARYLPSFMEDRFVPAALALIEPRPLPGFTSSFVDADQLAWARRWPAEAIWRLRRR